MTEQPQPLQPDENPAANLEGLSPPFQALKHVVNWLAIAPDADALINAVLAVDLVDKPAEERFNAAQIDAVQSTIDEFVALLEIVGALVGGLLDVHVSNDANTPAEFSLSARGQKVIAAAEAAAQSPQAADANSSAK